jgi:hypothetical protein
MTRILVQNISYILKYYTGIVRDNLFYLLKNVF